jgi:hypothetical protein
MALVATVAVSMSAFAQEEGQYERGQLYSVAEWSVDPAHGMAFEAAVKKVVAAAEQGNIAYRWAFWQNGSDYTLVYPVDSYAYFDDPMAFMKAFMGTPGEALMQEAMAEFEPLHITTLSDEIVEEKADWSYEVEGFMMSSVTVGHLDIMWLKPGAEAKFEQLNKDWSAFFADIDYPYPYVGHEIHFGNTGRVVYVTMIDDLSKYYGENDLMALVEASGLDERWQQLDELFGEVVARWEHRDIWHRPELSYWPMPEGATNE